MQMSFWRKYVRDLLTPAKNRLCSGKTTLNLTMQVRCRSFKSGSYAKICYYHAGQKTRLCAITATALTLWLLRKATK